MHLLLIKLFIIFFLKIFIVNTDLIQLPIGNKTTRAPGNTATRALGISNLKISTTISTTGVSRCGWRYGGEFDDNSFYSRFGCSNYTGVKETITCANNAGTVTSQLTLLQPQYKDLNINMQCSPSPSYSVNIVLKNCAAPKDVNVISNKSDYNSDGSVNCPSGSELFYKVNGSLVVDRTTTCNAYAEWTNINNMLCSKGPETLSITGNYTVGVIRGNKIALHCNYSGETPPAKFSRFYFNQKTRNVSRSSTWISPPLQASDNNKVVECQAVNQYTNYFKQSHRANITLNVTYPPDTVTTHITESKYTVKYGTGYLMRSDQILTINCSTSSNPTSEYQLKVCPMSNNGSCVVNNTSYYNDTVATLNISLVSCFVQNYLGNKTSQQLIVTVISTNRTVNIHITPNTRHLNESMRLERNLADNISITCTVDHQDQLNTTHTWKLPNGTKFIKQTLEFPALTPTDTGNYTCVTNDLFGNFSSSLYMDVIYPPETSNAKVICDWVINNTGVCNISFASNPPVDWVQLQDMKETIIDDTTNNCQCNTETQMYSFRVNKVTDSDFGKYSLKLKSSKFPDATLNVTIVIRDKNSNTEETKFPIIIVVAAGVGFLIIILVAIGVVLYVKKRRSIKDKKDVVNPSPGSRDIHTETGGVGENQSFANPAFENGAENSGLVTKSKKKQEYAVVQKGKKKKKTKDEKEIKDNPLYVAGSPDQVEDAYAEVNKKGKNIKEEKVNPLYATTQASGQTSGDYATVDLKKKKGKGITKKEEKINPLYVSSDQPDKVEDAYAEVDKKKNKKKIGKVEKEEKVNPLYGSSGQAGKVEEAYAEVDKKKNKKKIEKGEKEEKVNPLYVSSDQPDKVEDAYAEVDKKKNKKVKAKTGKAGKKGNSQQASSSGGHEEVDLNKKKKKEKQTKEEKVNPLYVSSDQPDKVEDAYAEVDKKKNKKKSATKPDKEEKVNPLYVSSDQPDKVEDAYAEVDKSKNKKKPIKATPTKDQPSTSKNETYTEVKKLKKKPLNQNNNENTQQTQDDATYYSVVLHGSHEKDKDKLDESEDSEQE